MPKIEIRQLQKLMTTHIFRNRRPKSRFHLKWALAPQVCETIRLPIDLNQ